MRSFGAIRRGFVLARIVAASCAVPLLPSCTQPTVFPRYLTVADVINNVKCELYAALREAPDSQWLDKWTAKFNVVLQVKRETAANGDFTFIVPYQAPVGVFTLVAGGAVGKSGQSRLTFEFNAEKTLGIFRSQDRCVYAKQLPTWHNLSGDTGLRLWFTTLIEGVNYANIRKQSTGFVYTLEFVTTVDGHIKPAFKSTYSSKKVFGGDFGIVRKRTDDNTLTVTFAKPAAPSVDLGKELAKIEAQLDELIKQRSTARAKLSQLQEKAERAKEGSQESFFLQERVTNAKNQLESLNSMISGVRAAQDGVRAVASATRQAAAASTDQQLNQLQLLDAIRDIPRR